MKGLKVIAAISFVLTLYPILAIPAKFKEWIFAFLSLFIFIISLTLLYVFSEDKMDKTYSENNPREKNEDMNELSDKDSKEDD